MKKQRIIGLFVMGIVLCLSGFCQADIQVNTYTNNNQRNPAIAMDSNGNFVVVWDSYGQDGSYTGIYGQRFGADGRPIGEEFQINTTTFYIQNRPDIAMAPDGHFVVTWQSDSELNIYARLFDPNGLPTTGEFLVNTYFPSVQRDPSVAMNSTGAFVIVWASWHGIDAHTGEYYITGRVYNATGVPQGNEFIVTQLPFGQDPDVAMDESGNFVVVWLRYSSGSIPPAGYYIRFRRYYANGTPKGDEVQITDGSHDGEPKIAMNSVGNFVLTWQKSDPVIWEEIDIYAQRFSSDPNSLPLSDPWKVNTYSDWMQLTPAISMNENGEYVIIWTTQYQEDDDREIFGQRYDSNDVAVGGEFHVNKYTEGWQEAPDTVMRNDGALFNVWESDGQDGSKYGIFGDWPYVPKGWQVPADYPTLQAAIDGVWEGDTVVAEPNIYNENINFKGKDLILSSTDPNDASIAASTIINGGGLGSTVTFSGGESAACQLTGFTITGGAGVTLGGGIVGNNTNTYPTISQCVVTGNSSTSAGGGIWGCGGRISRCVFANNSSVYGGGMAACHGMIANCLLRNNQASYGGAMNNCDGNIINCTIANNTATTQGALNGCDGTITNCIVWGNSPDTFAAHTGTIRYCCWPEGNQGLGNIDDNPGFADSNAGDYHLRSQAGRWDAVSQSWVYDTETSPCIDSGNPGCALQEEASSADNVRRNMGAYGGTAEASQTPVGWGLLADVTNNGRADLEDFAAQSTYWQEAGTELPGDLNRDGMVDIADMMLLFQDWMKQTGWYGL